CLGRINGKQPLFALEWAPEPMVTRLQNNNLHDAPPRLSLSAGLTGLPAAAMTAPTRSVASLSGSRIKGADRAVVFGGVWPSSARINGKLAPPLTSWLA